MLKKSKNLYYLLVCMLLFPITVFAITPYTYEEFGPAIALELFVTFHMTVFVIKPFSELWYLKTGKQIFKQLFLARVILLLFFDIFISPLIFIVDFFFVFIGAFLIIPIATLILKPKDNFAEALNASKNETIIKCPQCGTETKPTVLYCKNCGAKLQQQNFNKIPETKQIVTVANFDPMYSLDETKMLQVFIEKELEKTKIDISDKTIPLEILKKKKVLNIIFSILLFVYVCLIFFHFPFYTYLIGFIILFIFYKKTKKYDLIKYLIKEIKARPGEKISNIVMMTKNSLVTNNLKKDRLYSVIIAIALALLIFIKPIIMYEKSSDGYAVRFYAFGLTNFTTADIPDSYRDEKIVSLRGNTFSNMPFLRKVTLPNTIKEIRGQAFKNNIMLTDVNIPTSLEYLGGGAFYNAKSIKKVELPDTLTYLGGESFYGASSLETVRLSTNLTEIRGDSFEYCTSLKSINIPDNVTRIGGHAFYGDTALSEVLLTENSKLAEIGSSTFRQCSSLYSITIPSTTYVNERAFKESPTQVHRFDSNNYDQITNSSYYNNSNYKTSFSNYTNIGINKTVYFAQDDIKVSLLSLTDSRAQKHGDIDYTNENITGNLRIITNSNSYYYDFNFKDNNYYYYFENYVIKILPGVQINDNYVDYISLLLYDSQKFNPNFKYDQEYNFKLGTGITVASSKINKGCLLHLDNITTNGSNIEYTLTFSGYVNKTIKLNNTDNMSYKVDDNLMIKIISVQQDQYISIIIYYN